MPIYKFRSIEEMDAQSWRHPSDPELYRAISFVWNLAHRTNPRRFSPGVCKYRSIEEMNRADDLRLEAHITARAKHQKRSADGQP
jgi:hypothetical protein